ncbi:MAG: TolC family protein [Ignavibacteriales bacterium]|nr:TolC family protein [Ignavibacteriales bacterium]
MQKIIIILLAFFTLSYPLQSQQAARLVTLEQAVAIGLQNNRDLKSARLEVDRAEARVREAWGYALPSLDLAGRYTRALERPVFFLPDFADPGSNRTVAVQIGTEHAFDVTLSARQTIFNSTVIVGVGAAHVYADVSHQLYRQKELETVANVRKAFYSVLLAGEVRTLMRANLQNAEENLRNVRTMTTQGLVSEYDQLRAEVGVENLRPEVIRAENNYALSLDVLRTAMGIGVSETIDVDGSLEHRRVPEEILLSATELALRDNPGLQALKLQIEVNEAFVSAERSNYLPILSAFGTLQYQAAKNTFAISTNDFFRSAQVGFSLSFNIFQGLQTNAKVDQAVIEVRKSEEQLARTETDLRTAVHSLVLQLRQAQQRIDAQEKTVEQATRGYRLATTRFVSGSGTQLEVNDAQLALTQANVNRIQAIYDYLVASAALDQILGRMPEKQ